MAHPILMPKPGQMTEECVVVAWRKREGDPVRKGDVLFEIETDKSVMDVEAFDEGILLRRLVEEGQTVPVNAVCAYVGEPGEAVPEVEAGQPFTLAAEQAAAPVSSPVVAAPAGSAESTASRRAATPTAPVPSSTSLAPPSGRRAISPRASRLAAEAGIDPRGLAGSGPGGRIVERDVRAAVAAADPVAAPGAASSAPPPAPPAAPASAPPALPAWDGEEEPRPLSRMRRVIAERLSWSTSTIPHFSVTVSVDMTRLLALRSELKAAGTQLSVTDFVLAATAQTLAEFPEVNSRTDGSQLWLRRRVHLGLAVSVPNGLVVPVLRDADRRSLVELHERAVALADAARNGTLPPDELIGSTFTVSNLGMFGVDEFRAIINPGEAAILAVGSVLPTAVAVGEGLAVRQMMKLTLSADHRLVDGELGARFLNALRRRLQDVEAFRAEVRMA
ncbi:MAG TPA: dihydrolipoamide acetyltransferase family protein [Candidatus Limnocylindrales bacterium]